MQTLAISYSVCRFIHVVAIMQGFGFALFCEYLAPGALRDALRQRLSGAGRAMAQLCLATAMGIIVLQAGQMGDGWSQTLSPTVWLAVMNTAFGHIWLWHLLLALLTAVAVIRLPLSRPRHRLLLLAYGALLIGLALVGHSAMLDGPRGALQRANQVLHLFSAAWWLGCLVPLLLCLPLLRQPARPDALRALIRFSRGAHLAVTLVILTGIANTALVLGQWPFDWSSPYQRLLLAKIAVVTGMVILAIVNRYAVVPALKRHPDRATRTLTLLTMAEIALGGIALLLVSFFATFAP